MTFKEHIKQYETETESKVNEIIQELQLNSKSRKRENVSKRAFLYNELKTECEGMSLSTIGKMFNRDHATVINGLKTHDYMTSSGDKIYRKETEKIREYFYPSKLDKYKLLKKRILSTKSLTELTIIKSLIENDRL